MKLSILTIPCISFLLLINTEGNFSNKNSLIEKPVLQSKLNPDVPPSQNFNLKKFKLSIPSDNDNDGKSDNISVEKLNQGYQSEYFYTGKDGGMVFKCSSRGAKTSKNTKYVRAELREMLSGSDQSIDTKGVTKNNWVFSSAPLKDKEAAGAVDGEMKATLAINQVTTTGKKSQIGRIVIGQIHANTDEPIRLYYRKLKENRLGSIYFAHEISQGEDTYYNMIGGKSDDLRNPINGIALDEKFSYKIKVVGNMMLVTISRKGKKDVERIINMKESGYDKGGQYQYFKAGIYHLNNTANKGDFAQVTFYNLEVVH